MKYCEVSEDTPGNESGNTIWCITHDMYAIHVSPNGDDRICEEYAEARGCACCRENYDSEFVDIRIRKTELRSLLDETKHLTHTYMLLHHFFGDLQDYLEEPEKPEELQPMDVIAYLREAQEKGQ